MLTIDADSTLSIMLPTSRNQCLSAQSISATASNVPGWAMRLGETVIAVSVACLGFFASFNLWGYEAFTTDALAALNESALDAGSWASSPSIHLLLGGEEGVGGGTSALRQHTSAWEGMYEQPNVFASSGRNDTDLLTAGFAIQL